MIRSATHIFLSFLLLLATNGVVLSKHYCGGELRSTSIFQTKSCCGDVAKGKLECCDTKVELHKLDAEFDSGHVYTPIFQLVWANWTQAEIDGEIHPIFAVCKQVKLPERPPFLGPELHIRFQTFRI